MDQPAAGRTKAIVATRWLPANCNGARAEVCTSGHARRAELDGKPLAGQQQGLGQRKLAESALLTAQRLAPADPAMAFAFAIFYAQGGQHQQAIQWAEKLRSCNSSLPA